MPEQPPVTFNLFAYGTLMNKGLFENFVGDKEGLKFVESYPATLRDYERQGVFAAGFPAIIPKDDGEVRGTVYMNVPVSALRGFDMYESEGSLYHRRTRQAELEIGLEGRQMVTVQVYEWARKREELTGREWEHPMVGEAI